MPIRVSWYDPEETIVLYEFEGQWTWEELQPERDKALDMENAKPYRVDVLLDMRASSHIPVNALTHLRSFARSQPKNLGVSVIVSTSPFLTSLYNTALKLHPRTRLYFAVVTTMPDGLKLIAEQRAANAVL